MPDDTASVGGYQVVEAMNGGEALLLAQVERSELVILDRRMPGLTGDEVCGELRRHPATSALPVVMVTTDSGDDVQGYAFLAGANAFLQKPFHPSQLLETMNGAGIRRRVRAAVMALAVGSALVVVAAMLVVATPRQAIPELAAQASPIATIVSTSPVPPTATPAPTVAYVGQGEQRLEPGDSIAAAFEYFGRVLAVKREDQDARQ
jgi:CheY-like chemotaxis protein